MSRRAPTKTPPPHQDGQADPPGRLGVAYRPLADLVLDPRNPRAHSPRQVRQIARSIEAFGFNVPVLVDREDRVVAGHGRVLACRHLGRTEVPTIRLDHLDPARARAFMLADNRLAEASAWDERLLAETLRELDLEATGFGMTEIDLRIEGLDTPAAGALDPADAPCPPPPGPAVSRPGDLWLLGRHRLLCGDALDEGSYATVLAGERAAMVFTDLPYNVPIAGHVGGLNAVRHREFPMASGEMSPAGFTAFLRSALGLAARHSRDGSLQFVCMDWRHMVELMAAGAAAYAELKNVCIGRSNFSRHSPDARSVRGRVGPSGPVWQPKSGADAAEGCCRPGVSPPRRLGGAESRRFPPIEAHPSRRFPLRPPRAALMPVPAAPAAGR
jgi:hypothetical protein